MTVDKQQITNGIILLMEKASRLNIKTGYEQAILDDRIKAVEKFSMKAVISESQLGVIGEMAERYDEVMKMRVL